MHYFPYGSCLYVVNFFFLFLLFIFSHFAMEILIFTDVISIQSFLEEMFPMTTDDSLCGNENSARPDLIMIFVSEVESELIRINIIGDWTK